MKKLWLALCLACSSTAYAGWPTDAGDDVPVGTVATSQYPNLVNDGLQGVFVIFANSDFAQAKTLRAEHFNAQGDRLWSVADPDGGFVGKDLLGMTIGTNYYSKTLAVSDTDGGFIAAYTPGPSTGAFTLSLQRFDKDGNPEWTPTGTQGGVQLLANPIGYDYFWMVPDQLGGVLLTFQAAAGDIYGQRLKSDGTTDYGTGYKFAGGQYPGPFYASQFLNADGLGGMYFIWPTSGSSANSPSLDEVGAGGGLDFTVSSVASPHLSSFEEWGIAGLPAGTGCWASWWEPGTPSALYLQRFLPDGGSALASAPDAGGVLVSVTSIYNPGSTLVVDGVGGTVLAWFDQTAGVNALYAQRYASDGSPQWGAQPVLVSSSATTPSVQNGYTRPFRLIPTPDGDVALFWSATPNSIYAEKLAMTNGARLWGPLSGGVKVSLVAPQVQWLDALFAEDNSAYVAFQDSANRVYLKHLNSDGSLGTSAPDAGPPDAGPPDAGPPDAGPPPDAGFDGGPDAGPDLDAGPDAGPDSGAIVIGNDGGLTGLDGGGGDGGDDAGSSAGGSGCSSSTGSVGSAWAIGLGLMALTALRRRRTR